MNVGCGVDGCRQGLRMTTMRSRSTLVRTIAALATPCSAAPNVRLAGTGGAMDTQGFTNPVHVLGAEDEQDAQGEPDEQQENEDRS